jgi:hypothetical protein
MGSLDAKTNDLPLLLHGADCSAQAPNFYHCILLQAAPEVASRRIKSASCDLGGEPRHVEGWARTNQ